MTDNPDVLQNFFSEMMTRGLVANTESLVQVNDRMNANRSEEISDDDIEDASIHDMKAIESALGPIFGNYYRQDDRVHLDMATKDVAFVTTFIRSALMIMESFAGAMAKQREIATDVEALINNLTVKPHCEDTSHETFSYMVDQGFEARLVDMIATALGEATDNNAYHHVAQYLLELALIPRDHHGAQRMLNQVVSGSLVEMFAMEQIRQKPTKTAIRAIQGMPSASTGSTDHGDLKAPDPAKKPAPFLSVVKKD